VFDEAEAVFDDAVVVIGDELQAIDHGCCCDCYDCDCDCGAALEIGVVACGCGDVVDCGDARNDLLCHRLCRHLCHLGCCCSAAVRSGDEASDAARASRCIGSPVRRSDLRLVQREPFRGRRAFRM